MQLTEYRLLRLQTECAFSVQASGCLCFMLPLLVMAPVWASDLRPIMQVGGDEKFSKVVKYLQDNLKTEQLVSASAQQC